MTYLAKQMDCMIVSRTGEVELVRNLYPRCDKDFCSQCGECLACQVNPTCPDGSDHSWEHHLRWRESLTDYTDFIASVRHPNISEGTIGPTDGLVPNDIPENINGVEI